MSIENRQSKNQTTEKSADTGLRGVENFDGQDQFRRSSVEYGPDKPKDYNDLVGHQPDRNDLVGNNDAGNGEQGTETSRGWNDLSDPEAPHREVHLDSNNSPLRCEQAYYYANNDKHIYSAIQNSDCGFDTVSEARDKIYCEAVKYPSSVMEERQQRLKPGEYETSFDTSSDYHMTSLDSGPRVVAVEGWLRLQEGEAPQTQGEYGWDRGHLIGKQFGGGGDHTNIVLMDQRINRSFINAYEGAVADAIRDGRDLYQRVEVAYSDNGKANKLTYSLFERRENGIREVGCMVIDPSRSREYTLKQAVADTTTAREFANPFSEYRQGNWH